MPVYVRYTYGNDIHVIVHVVRDAASRLPNGEGTRLDVRFIYELQK